MSDPTFFSADLRMKDFTHLYCHICEEVELPKIWKDHSDKLPEEISIKDLFYNWDKLGKSHMDIDILGCLIPNEPGISNYKASTSEQ